MKNPIQFTKVIAPVEDSLNAWLRRRGLLLIPLVLVLALPIWSAAGCDEICDSLNNGISGNTGFGFLELASLTTGDYNTAFGTGALSTVTTGHSNTIVGSFVMTGAREESNYNTVVGGNAMRYSYGCSYNTVIGAYAMGWSDENETHRNTGSYNTATGYEVLFNNENGSYNTANGIYALAANTTGSYNTAGGASALGSNSDGNNNTATGAYAIRYGHGDNNTATGYAAMQGTTEAPNEGNDNTATGANALYSNTSGINNTANGANALYTNSNGNNNTATGEGALYGNKTGSGDTANGQDALYSNTDGNSNTATGFGALFSNTSGFSNTANGWSALLFNTTGSNNIGLGVGAGGNLTTGDNNIDIGNTGVAGESAKIRIGTKGTHKNTYVAGIYGVTVPRGLGVIVDSSGHLGTSTSSARFKDEIKPMDKASEAILKLAPVTFRYKPELDPDGIPQFGLVAEQVEKVNPDLVARDEQGKPYTVRYEAVNAMLLNEFLKEHRRVEEQVRQVKEQEATIMQLKWRAAKQEVAIADQQKSFEMTSAKQAKRIETLFNTLQEQALQIQKVTARLAAGQSAPRVVINDQSNTIR